MDRITMLGTGHAMTIECFNTCFVYENENGKMLVDTGGGQQLITQLRKAGIEPDEINCVFLSHRHTDHILGLPWLLRVRMRSLESHPLTIITHPELCDTVKTLISALLPEASEYLGQTLLIIPVAHNQKSTVLGRNLRFFDTQSGDVTQFGFILTLAHGGKFVFNGDVPCSEANSEIISRADWLMHEAFCLEREKMSKMKKHSSVAEAASNAAAMGARGLILVHCGDRELPLRRERYSHEAAAHFTGHICVPYDMEQLEL